MQSYDRLHYMDNLRALTMLAGVVFHAALAYSPLMHSVWPLADTGQSQVADVVAWFSHLFRMPLFFVVAGFFAAMLAARHGIGGLFRNRSLRVLLPLMLFLPLVLISMQWLTANAVANVAHPSPMLAWLRTWVAQNGEMPSMPSWAHLWFLFYLMLFTVLVWVGSALGLRHIGDRIFALPPAALVLLLPLALAMPLSGTTIPWAAPEFLLPSLWALAFFGLYFALGYQVFHRPAMINRIGALAPALLVSALVAYAVLFVMTGGFTAKTASSLQRPLLILLEAAAGLWMTLWCLFAGKRWLDKKQVTMRWLADASYWVYLVHLPLLFAIQYRLLDLSLHWAAKFAIAVLATFAASLASYQLLVRHTIVGTLLNGHQPRA